MKALDIFLSCLFGSEHPLRACSGGFAFLSCLFGSERFERVMGGRDHFLSCLFGSEQDVQTVAVV